MGFETFLLYLLFWKSLHLNFVPMGFETELLGWWFCIRCQIWTLSLWDLKLSSSTSSFPFSESFELCPYGIWNVRVFKEKVQSNLIWTLSLWDLKHKSIYRPTKCSSNLNFVPMGFETAFEPLNCYNLLFELCPYGIWNAPDKRTFREMVGFELCPYGIWNR